MEPVVYDFAINEHGTLAELLRRRRRADARRLLHARRAAAAAHRTARPLRRRAAPSSTASPPPAAPAGDFAGMVQNLFDRLLPRAQTQQTDRRRACDALLETNGFDRVQHEQIRDDLRAGRIGLAQNRLPANSDIEDVAPGDVVDATRGLDRRYATSACRRCADGEVAVVSLAAGVGSRWTQGAGVVKALNPVLPSSAAGTAASSKSTWPRAGASAAQCGAPLPHVVTTSYLTHEPIEQLSRGRRATTATPARCCSRPGAVDRPAPGPDGARPALRLGGDAAADARRAGAEGAREPARRADRLGRSRRAKAPTTPTTCRCSACTRSATGSRCRTCCATACCARLLAERPQLQLPAGPQHRHARRRPRPGAARASTSRAAPR